MDTLTLTTDHQARISLPQSFANSKVIIEQVSESEVRIRKADGPDEEQVRFPEESRPPLSDRDRDRFLELLDHPPGPNEALRKAATEFQERHG